MRELLPDECCMVAATSRMGLKPSLALHCIAKSHGQGSLRVQRHALRFGREFARTLNIFLEGWRRTVCPADRRLRLDLFEHLGVKARENVILDCIADLDGLAADFTVFDVGLATDRNVEDHRNFFPAVRAGEAVFHYE